jgi:glycosyltransferase involved in cell wall biosynthesis
MTPNNPLVSIVIPCYNHGKYLHECLYSVLAQTYKNIEIIIVNDGSTDIDTNKIIDELDTSVYKIIHKKNEGLSAARNDGIISALGDFILPLDADDKLGNSYIEKAIALFSANSDIQLVFCKGKYFGAENVEMNNVFISYKSELLYNAIFPACVYRKEDCISAGMYNMNMNKGMEDWDFLIRLLADNKKVVQIPEVLFYYRRTGESMWDGLSKASATKMDMENRLFENNVEIYKKEWGSIIQVLRDFEIMKNENRNVQTAIENVQKTLSYRIGHFILYPFKLLRNIK